MEQNDHYGAKMVSGVNWGQWTILGPNDPTGPFIWHISQHTTTATSPIIVNTEEKKSKTQKNTKKFRSQNFFSSSFLEETLWNYPL